MKKLLWVMLAAIMLFSMAACAGQKAEPEQTPEQTAEQTPESKSDWEYDASTHTLYVNADMGAFEPDAPDFDGTTSNAPWAEFLPEIENVIVSDEVTVIGDYAFAFCTNLKNVAVGNSVSSLDFRCFFKCGDFDNDSKIDMHFNSTPSFGDDVFGYTWDNPNVVIYVPDDMKEYWAQFIMQKGEMALDGYDLVRPISKDDVLYSMLANPQELWSEGSGGFSENDGGEFGGGVKKGYNADMQRLEIFGEENGACAKFNTSLMTCMSDVGMEKIPQQAVVVKFSASDISNGARVSFDALDEIDFWFGDDGVKFVDVANFFEMPITDFMPNNLELKDDTIYYFFFAFDAEGNIRMFIWEDGSAENKAYFEYDLYQDAADIDSCDLIMHLAIGADEQFNLYEYWIYTFDSFMDSSSFISSGDNQNGDTQNADEDLGPAWTINIAGNFDIMSDLVWQSIELQDIEAGGDTFKGYNLADMMDFSGNGSDAAIVKFADGSEAEATPTFDTFIVFKQNGELLGAPYVLSMDGLSEQPVVEVYPK